MFCALQAFRPIFDRSAMQPNFISMRIFLALSVLTAVLTSHISTAQTHEKPLDFHVKGAEDTVIYLANYYGSKLYYADTAQSDAEGNIHFKAKPRDAGKYAVVIPGPRFFEIILADGDDVEMTTDTMDFQGKMEVIQSKNNKALYEYVHFLNEKKAEKMAIEEEAQTAKKKKHKEELLKRMDSLNKEVRQWQEDYVERYSDLFAGKEVNLTLEVQVPDSIEEDRNKAYEYYRDHFWDRADLDDERLVRSPLFAKKLERYMNDVLLQNPDTMIKYMDRLISKVEDEPELFKFIVHRTTYNFETAKIMGMDKGFVHMVEKYYTPEKAFWMDSTKLGDMNERARKMKPLLIGKKSPNIILPDSSGNWINLYQDVKEPYTLLFFYDPDCGHCKKATPKMVEYYNERGKDQGLAIYTITTDAEKDKWEEFLEKHKMVDFINTAVPQKAYEDQQYATQLVIGGTTTLESLNYQDTFDVFSTPKILLLNKDKEIIAKQLGVEQIGDFIERHEKQQEKKMQ